VIPTAHFAWLPAVEKMWNCQLSAKDKYFEQPKMRETDGFLKTKDRNRRHFLKKQTAKISPSASRVEHVYV
jgi:hypothetical protein